MDNRELLRLQAKTIALRRTRLSAPTTKVTTDLDRDISASRGCFQPVRGPFEHDMTTPGFRKSSACERSANHTLQPTANPLRGLSAAELGR